MSLGKLQAAASISLKYESNGRGISWPYLPLCSTSGVGVEILPVVLLELKGFQLSGVRKSFSGMKASFIPITERFTVSAYYRTCWHWCFEKPNLELGCGDGVLCGDISIVTHNCKTLRRYIQKVGPV